MNPFMIFGIFLISWGVFALSLNTKNLPWALKFSPVLLTATGIILLWLELAASVPVIVNAQIEILDVKKDQITVTLDFVKVRNCEYNGTEAYLVNSGGASTKASLIRTDKGIPLSRPLGHIKTKSIYVINTIPSNSYDKFYFVRYDTCPFDVKVKTTFGLTDVPSGFN